MSWISGDVDVAEGLSIGDMIAAGMRGYRSALPGPTMVTPDQLARL